MPKAPLLAPPGPPTLTFRWDGAAIPACPGDTVASALIAAGELATSRSAKYRRLRGPACLHGGCGTCLVRVDGRPNQRACLTPVREDMLVEPQNTYGGLDPTALVDQIFRRGIDHHHLVVYPRIANQMMQGVARELAGFGELPDAPPAEVAGLVDHVPEVLVIGAGRSGRALAAALTAGGHTPRVVERRPAAALAGPDLPADLLAGVGVFACYPQERLWAAASEQPPVLHRLRPRHVVLAVGAHEPTIPLANNDLPGVVSARGLVDMLEQTGRRLTARVVVIGEGARAEHLAGLLAAERVAPARVHKLLGARRVKGVQLDDRRILRCDLVALAPDPAPAFELAAQAGAPIHFTGAGFAPVCDADGRIATAPAAHPLEAADAQTAPPPPWTLWAVGELAGATTPPEIRGTVDRCAAALLRALAESPAPEDSQPSLSSSSLPGRGLP
ncbi:2Fe-2S iron-sulfur cluster-binding protein [Nannocystis punicea]|uniref:2Fe-2S iron-sulfur cluster-binding protein n=1 Tax=Nannocystis punicea TaxID=2995304 RepID=A0ABY7HFK7_9BACT|nr:2Fe-2S iron-sulfur cluster-binding protein [Nannocystis poenicansa]WAS97870.1 2Fe-2S iron-sulfur cluster-binding protein [Nannocystis poenicansa]